VEPELAELLETAQNDHGAVGVVLFGSAATGSAHAESDIDVWYVVRSEPPPAERRGRLELIPTTLERLRNPPDWLRPAYVGARVLWDPEGEIEPVVAATQLVGRDETEALYDAYLNDLYRSLKAWWRGLELAARVECGRSLRFLGELLFALDGRRAPYPKEWEGRLGDLEPLFLEVARTADPARQQELCVAVQARAAAAGYAHVVASWRGDIERVLAFDFV
jgi:predicted nucleotidyltransferase